MAIYVLPLGLPSWIQTFCFLIIFFVFFFTVLVVSPVQQIFQATATSYKRANEEPMGNVGTASCRSQVFNRCLASVVSTAFSVILPSPCLFPSLTSQSACYRRTWE